MERHFQVCFSSVFGLHQEIFVYGQEIGHVTLKCVVFMIRFFNVLIRELAVFNPVLIAKLTVAVH